jgi:nicotinate-nucleotide pyrophosphorylase
MPFYYDIKVPDLKPEKTTSKYLLVKWLLPLKADIATGTALAIVSDGEARYLLRNAGPGFFSQWHVQEGDEISPGQTIGRITTDGELIPYGRPYVTLEPAPSHQP